MAHYADTSFLVSLYVQDAFSNRAQAWLAKNPVANHTAQLGTRTLDVLHVASAQGLGVVDFVSFDSRQAALARAVGLTWHLP